MEINMLTKLDRTQWLIIRRSFIINITIRLEVLEKYFDGPCESIDSNYNLLGLGSKMYNIRTHKKRVGNMEKTEQNMALWYEYKICLDKYGAFINQIGEILTDPGIGGLQFNTVDKDFIRYALIEYRTNLRYYMLRFDQGYSGFEQSPFFFYVTATIAKCLGDNEMKINEENMDFWNKENDAIDMILNQYFRKES
jgi:hypothetical protein